MGREREQLRTRVLSQKEWFEGEKVVGLVCVGLSQVQGEALRRWGPRGAACSLWAWGSPRPMKDLEQALVKRVITRLWEC